MWPISWTLVDAVWDVGHVMVPDCVWVGPCDDLLLSINVWNDLSKHRDSVQPWPRWRVERGGRGKCLWGIFPQWVQCFRVTHSENSWWSQVCLPLKMSGFLHCPGLQLSLLTKDVWIFFSEKTNWQIIFFFKSQSRLCRGFSHCCEINTENSFKKDLKNPYF